MMSYFLGFIGWARPNDNQAMESSGSSIDSESESDPEITRLVQMVQMVALPHLKLTECRCGVVVQALGQQVTQRGTNAASMGEKSYKIMAIKMLDSELMRQQRDSFDHEVKMMQLLQPCGVQEPLAQGGMLRWDHFILSRRGPKAQSESESESQPAEAEAQLQSQLQPEPETRTSELQCVAMDCAWGQSLCEWVMKQVDGAERQLARQQQQQQQQLELQQRLRAGAGAGLRAIEAQVLARRQARARLAPTEVTAAAADARMGHKVACSWFGVAVQIMVQILRVVKYMHSQGVCHLDLDFGNLMMDKPDWPAAVKLGDYGSCQHIGVGIVGDSEVNSNSSTIASTSTGATATASGGENGGAKLFPAEPLSLPCVKTKASFCAPELSKALGELGKRCKQARVQRKRAKAEAPEFAWV